MKKVLLIAIALIVAGSIAFAISAFSGGSGDSRTPRVVEVQDDPSGGEGTLDMDFCIADVGIWYCLPEPVGKCRVVYEVQHWDKSDWCCAHDAGDLYFRVGGEGHEWEKMTIYAWGFDLVRQCFFHMYHTSEKLLDNHTRPQWDVYDTNEEACNASGSYPIDCQ